MSPLLDMHRVVHVDTQVDVVRGTSVSVGTASIPTIGHLTQRFCQVVKNVRNDEPFSGESYPPVNKTESLLKDPPLQAEPVKM